MKVGERYRAKVTDVNFYANGVCRIDGIAVFVPETAVGDDCEIEISEVYPRYAIGKAVTFYEKSEDHVPSRCPNAVSCGGCAFAALSYEAECRAKMSFIRGEAIKRGLSLDVLPLLSPSGATGYRNKAVFYTNASGALGFYEEKSHDLVPLTSCAICPDAFLPVAREAAARCYQIGLKPYDPRTKKGDLRGVSLRQNAKGEIALTLLLSETSPVPDAAAADILETQKNVLSVWIDRMENDSDAPSAGKYSLIGGQKTVSDTLSSLSFSVSPKSFYQVNRLGAECLYREAEALLDLRPGERCADLYCGTGTIGLILAKANPECTFYGVEIVEEAVRDAKANAKTNGVSNISFFCGDASDFDREVDACVIDPPRKGCSADMIATLCRLAPSRIVYISCNPATMMRDISLLKKEGYGCESVRPVNLFPGTSHVETVVLMSRDKE